MKRITALLMLCFIILSGCKTTVPSSSISSSSISGDAVLEKYQGQFFGTFDTVIQFTAYCSSREEFDSYLKMAEDEFIRLHRLFDRFSSYEGITNLRDINENAGGEPMKADPALIECLKLSLDWYEKSGGKVNVAMGTVTDVYKEYISMYSGVDPQTTELPDEARIKEASGHIDINNIILDEENGTIAISDPELIIDLGATAKGFATEKVAQMLEAKGLTSFILSAGGNVRCGTRPEDGLRAAWGVGLENPDRELIKTDDGVLDVAFLNNMSVVSSGDYQRFYISNDKRIHHLVDPDTLLPGDKYRSVIVVAPDSAMSDALSTAVFMLDMESGKELCASVGAEALWVTPDGKITVTDGLLPYLRDMGGAVNTR